MEAVTLAHSRVSFLETQAPGRSRPSHSATGSCLLGCLGEGASSPPTQQGSCGLCTLCLTRRRAVGRGARPGPECAQACGEPSTELARDYL